MSYTSKTACGALVFRVELPVGRLISQEAWKAGAGSHGPISLQMSMRAPEVPFAWNVNRMEGSSLMAGAGALGLTYVWDRLKLPHAAHASRYTHGPKGSCPRLRGPEASGPVVFVVQNNRDRSKGVCQTRLAKRLRQGLKAETHVRSNFRSQHGQSVYTSRQKDRCPCASLRASSFLRGFKNIKRDVCRHLPFRQTIALSYLEASRLRPCLYFGPRIFHN